MILTENEKKAVRLLATSYGKDYSINEIARACRITPNGAYKLLAKLESEGIIKARNIANIKAYRLDFEGVKTESILKLALMPNELEGRIAARAEDLKPLRAVAKACIIFGSYITSKHMPNDLDILFILEQKKFNEYKKILAKVREIIPIKAQDVVQTAEDMAKNLKKNDLVITEAMRKGVVLWGFDTLVEVIRNGAEQA